MVPLEWGRPTHEFSYVVPSSGRERTWRRTCRLLARRPCGKTAGSSNGHRKHVHELLDVSSMLQAKRTQVAALEAHMECKTTHAAVLRCLQQAKTREPVQPDEVDELEIQCEQLERRLDSSACELLLRRREMAATAAHDTRNVSILVGLLEDVTVPNSKRLQSFLNACTGAELRGLQERALTLAQAAQQAFERRNEEERTTWGAMKAGVHYDMHDATDRQRR